MKPSDAEERKFLREYRKQEWPRPAVTVDIVILTILDADLKVLLIKRKEHPFKDRWALPGGFLRVGDAYDDQGEDPRSRTRRPNSIPHATLPRGGAPLCGRTIGIRQRPIVPSCPNPS